MPKSKPNHFTNNYVNNTDIFKSILKHTYFNNDKY